MRLSRSGAVLGATAQRLLANPDTGTVASPLQIIVDTLTAVERLVIGHGRMLASQVRSPSRTHRIERSHSEPDLAM